MKAASSRDRAPFDHALDPEGPVMFEGLAWAEMVLRDQEMPPDELRVVLTTADRELVRRHLELHLERLEEWLSNQRRRIAAVERIVAEAIERPRPARSPSPAVAIVHASVDLEARGRGTWDGRRRADDGRLP